MIYKRFQDLKLSALGLGMMRLPTIDGDDSKIDEARTAEIVDRAIKGGINYFDTAWGYHSGNSELVAGKLLSKYPRESYYLASKFPGYSLSNMGKTEEIFEKQLEKCRTEYFDFYLFHNVCEMNIDYYLNDGKYGTYSYLIKQKKNGRIKHLGFSAHGDLDVLKRFLDAYGKDMEFCQLQLNYLDFKFQNAEKKVELVKNYGIPVWVMEPLRGGKLCNMPEYYKNKLKELRPDETAVGWAFRFIQSIKEVCVTLSGMSSVEQLEENLKIFSEDKPLNEAETAVISEMVDDMVKKKPLPCTACHYCVSQCPMGLDIPKLIELYNEHVYSDGGFLAPMAISAIPENKRPSACLGCRSCEEVCPQQIKISEAMANFSRLLSK